MPARLPTPPPSPTAPQLILCADGGGSKVCVVIRSEDGLEVRGTAGPCNVQSVGYTLACQSILLATYRALAQLPRSYLPGDLALPAPDTPDTDTPDTDTADTDTADTAPPLAQRPTPPSSLESAAPAQVTSSAGGRDGNAIHPLPALMTHLSLAATGPAPAMGVDGLSPFASRAATPSPGHRSGHGRVPLPSAPVHAHPRSPSAPPSAPGLAPAKASQSRSRSARPRRLPALNLPIFRYAWLGLAGISSKADEKAFAGVAAVALGIDEKRVKVSNDVNLLAAPALDLPEVDHVVAVVAGTGTVGRAIRVSGAPGGKGEKRHGLPLEDVAVSRGWGYLLCDEGSAFWIGRLAIRNLLALSDRLASSSIYAPAAPSRPAPQFTPLHRDLMEYFGTGDPGELIGVASLMGGGGDEGAGVGEATSKRNALIAGAARVVFRWAFPESGPAGGAGAGRAGSAGSAGGRTGMPTPPASTDGGLPESDTDDQAAPDLAHTAHLEALALARQAAAPLIELTLSLLGDRSVVQPARAALALGGGLMMCEGYRAMLLEGLEREGVSFKRTVVVADAAGEGARGLGRVEWE